MGLGKSISVILLVLVLLAAGCSAPAPGPRTWIDAPLDDSNLPDAPIYIMAHASDGDGIAKIEFYVDGQLINSGAPAPFEGARLGQVETRYTPPGPGEYRIEAVGIDSAGNKGAPAFVRVTISAEPAGVAVPEDECPPDCPIQPEEPAPAELAPAGEPDVTEEESEVAPAVTDPIVVARTNANCRQGPGTLYSVYGSLPSGEQAEIKGRLGDNSWLLVSLAGRSANCWISSSVVDVQGDLATVGIAAAPPLPVTEPSTEPPTADVIDPEPIDITPPSFFNIAAAPDPIYVQACPGFDHVTTVAAVPADESGIASVVAHWSIAGGESGQKTLSKYELGWGADIGNVSTPGTMIIYFIATDTEGNSGQSSNISVTVKNCLE